jgi:exodeoxyribonuclease VII large subunit
MVKTSNTLPLFDYDNTDRLEYTVTEVSNLIKRTIEGNFESVRIRGEISGLKIAPSGHVYFSLKDNNAVLASICWKNTFLKLQFKPEEGLEVVCTGTLTTFPAQSKYQLTVTSLEPAGLGTLMALLEKRKEKLQKEGLFDQEHKKPLPFLPKTIGIITSPTGAVIRDIIHRIEDRCPTHIIVWPVLVQGESAAQQIAEAIYGFNNLDSTQPIPKPDVLIVARGGGSIEDLWAFNEEIVARATFNSIIPIISAVGHETDVTLIDYVADKRAPTPTAAAEMAVPVLAELVATLNDLNNRLNYNIQKHTANLKTLLEATYNALPKLHSIITYQIQRLDDLNTRLYESLPQYLKILKNELQTTHSRLKSPLEFINIWFEKLDSTFNKIQYLIRPKIDVLSAKLLETEDKIKKSFYYQIETIDNKLLSLKQLLESYNYKNTLKRGFSIIRDDKKNIIKSITKLNTHTSVSIEMHDGTKQTNLK